MKICITKKQAGSSTTENDSLNINEMNIQFEKSYEFDIKEEEIDEWLLIPCFFLDFVLFYNFKFYSKKQYYEYDRINMIVKKDVVIQ